jgi:dihydrolipoamide dehydrogenase
MSQATHTTDVVVIGGGPGGYTAAFLAADRGMSVTLVDEAPRPGGVCLYRGCMPSKALLHAAKVVNDARQASVFGVSFGSPSIDVDRLRGWKDDVVSKLTGGLAQLTKQRGITYLQGRATFADAQTLAVDIKTDTDSSAVVCFRHAIVATGSRPSKPEALSFDDPRVLDSTSALELQEIPSSLLVVGGGYIGLELGTVYAALGSAVTVVELTKSLLPGADADLVRVLERSVGRVVEAIHLETEVAGLTAAPGGIDVSLRDMNGGVRTEQFKKVLIAVGRQPNSDCVGLQNTAVSRDGKGFIVTDAQCQTAEKSIFAIGDVSGEPMLAHKGFAEARVAVEAIGGQTAVFAPKAIPAVVFTDPEVAWCGLTEDEATTTGRKVAVAKFPWGASGRALTLSRPEGFTKLVVDPENEQILGVGIVGVGAGELIAEGVVAVEMGMTVSDMRMSIHPHPTVSETFGEAAELFLGECTHVYKPKKS